ncbi:hypothetical protein M0805_007409 [Coniferiporia weirii]|nr:hypothetical protein M0805_007409 [Coniferiporia weirii]
MAAAALVLPAVPVTPPDYHRIVSPHLSILNNKSLPVPVGLLACQRDPLLRELSSTVVSCSAHQPVEQASSASKKKKQVAVSDKLFEVILHDTILFPEGGGQPSDVGFLRTVNGEEYDVLEVKRCGGHAVHFVKSKDGEVPGLGVGAQVTAALGDAGYMRRLDHMCMHTSQHVLSALLETHLNLPTLSWALTAYPTPAYVELPRALTPDEIVRIQAMAHTLAYEGRSVHVEVEPLDSENHPGVATLDSGRTVGKALPKDYTGGVKRTVVIDGVDRNPCCGTHLPTLHNLQLFILPQAESLSRGSTSTSRLFFLCGPRLHAHLATSHTLVTETAGIMSCGASQVHARVAQVVEERRRAEKRAEELAAELAGAVSSGLLSEMERSISSSGDEQVPYTRHYHRMDDPSSALTFLQAVSSAFASALTASPNAAARPYVLVLNSSPVSQTGTSTSTVLLLSSDEKLVRFVGDALKVKLGVKGGGRGVRWSGKWVGVWKDAKEGAIVNEILASVQA